MSNNTPRRNRRTVLATTASALAISLGATTAVGWDDDDDWEPRHEEDEDNEFADEPWNTWRNRDCDACCQPNAKEWEDPCGDWDWNDDYDHYMDGTPADDPAKVYKERAIERGLDVKTIQINQLRHATVVDVVQETERWQMGRIRRHILKHARLYARMVDSCRGQDELRCEIRYDGKPRYRFLIDRAWAEAYIYEEIDTREYYRTVEKMLEERD